jgi:uncharacterized cupin superfamily protein
MTTKACLAAVASLLVVGLASLPAHAQAQKAAEAKGVKVKALISSLGGFSATVSTPIFVTGATVELEPGGQTGRQEFRVPTYIYVLEGVLTSEYEAGPIGIKGTQYHAEGQSLMDNGGVGWWHNFANRSDKPVRYLMLHLGYPGRPDPIQTPDKED